MKKEIEFLARAISKVDGNFLVCKKKNEDYYFFPGGHIEFGETSKEALKREIMEELGVKVESCEFIGGSEHFFVQKNVERHEVSLAFFTTLEDKKIESQEDHLDFFLFSKQELEKEKVFPEPMKNAVLEWLDNKKIFWKNSKK